MWEFNYQYRTNTRTLNTNICCSRLLKRYLQQRKLLSLRQSAIPRQEIQRLFPAAAVSTLNRSIPQCLSIPVQNQVSHPVAVALKMNTQILHVCPLSWRLLSRPCIIVGVTASLGGKFPVTTIVEAQKTVKTYWPIDLFRASSKMNCLSIYTSTKRLQCYFSIIIFFLFDSKTC